MKRKFWQILVFAGSSIVLFYARLKKIHFSEIKKDHTGWVFGNSKFKKNPGLEVSILTFQ